MLGRVNESRSAALTCYVMDSALLVKEETNTITLTTSSGAGDDDFSELFRSIDLESSTGTVPPFLHGKLNKEKERGVLDKDTTQKGEENDDIESSPSTSRSAQRSSANTNPLGSRISTGQIAAVLMLIMAVILNLFDKAIGLTFFATFVTLPLFLMEQNPRRFAGMLLPLVAYTSVTLAAVLLDVFSASRQIYLVPLTGTFMMMTAPHAVFACFMSSTTDGGEPELASQSPKSALTNVAELLLGFLPLTFGIGLIVLAVRLPDLPQTISTLFYVWGAMIGFGGLHFMFSVVGEKFILALECCLAKKTTAIKVNAQQEEVLGDEQGELGESNGVRSQTVTNR